MSIRNYFVSFLGLFSLHWSFKEVEKLKQNNFKKLVVFTNCHCSRPKKSTSGPSESLSNDSQYSDGKIHLYRGAEIII